MNGERQRIPLWPKTIGGVVFLAVVALVCVGLLIVAFGPWRRGISLMGGALLIGAVARSQLADFPSGMLRVRRKRWVDVATLGFAGLALIALAISIPNQPG